MLHYSISLLSYAKIVYDIGSQIKKKCSKHFRLKRIALFCEMTKQVVLKNWRCFCSLKRGMISAQILDMIVQQSEGIRCQQRQLCFYKMNPTAASAAAAAAAVKNISIIKLL